MVQPDAARIIKRFFWGSGVALYRFNRDDGWAIASHIALSGIMALFPFLIFCTSLAAFLNLGEFPDQVMHLIFDNLPQAIASTLAEQARIVLTVPRGDILTFGAALALFFASNGVEALRLGLNRAYRTAENRNFVFLRLESILFVVVSAVIIATTTFLLVLAPLALEIAQRFLPFLRGHAPSIDFWRLAASALILAVALVTSHKWLPAGNRTLREIWPGIIVTLIFWLAGAHGFALYLKSFANYVDTYAGIAGVIVALVFFYLMSVIFLLGAEINAAIIEARNTGKFIKKEQDADSEA